jgi:hypothetical protein
MTRTLIALAAAAMSITCVTGAAAQALYIEDEYAPPVYGPAPIYVAPPAYGVPAPLYGPPVYALAPPVYLAPAPTYVPRVYANRPRMIYDSGYGSIVVGDRW